VAGPSRPESCRWFGSPLSEPPRGVYLTSRRLAVEPSGPSVLGALRRSLRQVARGGIHLLGFDNAGLVHGSGMRLPSSTARITPALLAFALLVSSCSGSDSTGDTPSSTSPQPTTANVVDEIPADTSATAPAVPEPTERSVHVILPDGTPIEYLYRAFIQLPVGMTLGPDGLIYIADHGGRHVVRITAEGEAEDLGIWRKNPGIWESDGPIDIAFDSTGTLYVNDHSNIYRVDSEGHAEALPGLIGGPTGIAFGKFDGQDILYYSNRSSDPLTSGVRWWLPEGRSGVVALNIPGAEDIVVADDGTIYVSQISRGTIARINPDWQEQEVVTEFASGGFLDPTISSDGVQLFLALDAEGDIWANSPGILRQFAPDGTEKVVELREDHYTDLRSTSAGLAFDAEGRLWVTSYNSMLIRLDPLTKGADPTEFSVVRPLPGLEASDLAFGPSGEVVAYNENTAEVWRFDGGGQRTILAQFTPGGRVAVAIDDQGTVFLGFQEEIVFLDEDGTPIHYAWVGTNRMVFGPDGALYVVAGDEAFDHMISKSIVRISGVDSVETITETLGGNPISGQTHIALAPGDELFVFVDESGGLYVLGLDGESRELANLESISPIGASIMASGPTGDVFFIGHKNYWLFRIDSDGESEKLGEGFKGDPWGMVVSRDGRVLYLAESGAIDMVPIG